jgi:hypothetical protein
VGEEYALGGGRRRGGMMWYYGEIVEQEAKGRREIVEQEVKRRREIVEREAKRDFHIFFIASCTWELE